MESDGCATRSIPTRAVVTSADASAASTSYCGIEGSCTASNSATSNGRRAVALLTDTVEFVTARRIAIEHLRTQGRLLERTLIGSSETGAATAAVEATWQQNDTFPSNSTQLQQQPCLGPVLTIDDVDQTVQFFGGGATVTRIVAWASHFSPRLYTISAGSACYIVAVLLL